MSRSLKTLLVFAGIIFAPVLLYIYLSFITSTLGAPVEPGTPLSPARWAALLFGFVGVCLWFWGTFRLFRFLTGREDPGGKAIDSIIVFVFISGSIGIAFGVLYGGDWLRHKVFNSGPIAEKKMQEAENERRNAESTRALEEQARQRRNAEAQKQRIQERIPEFATLPPRTQLASQPYVKGKLIAINLAVKPAVSQLATLYGLSEITATSPEEVATVVLLNYREVRAGTYDLFTRHIPGYNWVCDLTLIDRSIPATIYRKTIKGKPLGNDVTVGMNSRAVYGDKPTKEVEDFLIHLPHR